jgi:hypothetical protein
MRKVLVSDVVSTRSGTEIHLVLLYLESLPRHSEYISPASPTPSEFRRLTANQWAASESEESEVSYGEVTAMRQEEWNPNVQERGTSGPAEAIPVYTGLVCALCWAQRQLEFDK